LELAYKGANRQKEVSLGRRNKTGHFYALGILQHALLHYAVLMNFDKNDQEEKAFSGYDWVFPAEYK